MPRKIMIDSGVVIEIHKGNERVAEVLRGLLNDGHTVLVSDPVYKELTVDSKSKRMRTAYTEWLKDSKIQKAPSTTLLDRMAVYENNIEDMKISQKQKKEAARTGKPAQPNVLTIVGDDKAIVAEAKLAKAELWSLDRDIRANISRIDKHIGKGLVAPETHEEIPVMGKGSKWSYRGARRLMELKPIKIDKNGRIVPKKGGGGGLPGLPGAPVGGASGGRIARVARTLAAPAGQAALAAIGGIMNKITDAREEKKAKDAADKIWLAIGEELNRDPTMGVLLVYHYAEHPGNPESVVQPTGVFMDLRYAFGHTKDEAIAKLRRDESVRPPVQKGANTVLRTQEVFIPPAAEPAIKDLVTPFPHAALGKFVDGKAKLEKASWTGFGGFNAEGTQELAKFLAMGTFQNAIFGAKDPKIEPEFIILDPPSKLTWYNGKIRRKSDVDVTRAVSANGVGLEVVELDNGLLSDDILAAMVFPADGETQALFEVAPPTEGYRSVRDYTNFNMVRWVRPEYIHITKKL